MTREEIETDVLIIGAGPAGYVDLISIMGNLLISHFRLMVGTWMAKTGVKAIIIDQKPQSTQTGHADGIESRTLEIFDSFGIAGNIWEHANRTIDLSIWVRHTALSVFIIISRIRQRWNWKRSDVKANFFY